MQLLVSATPNPNLHVDWLAGWLADCLLLSMYMFLSPLNTPYSQLSFLQGRSFLNFSSSLWPEPAARRHGLFQV